MKKITLCCSLLFLATLNAYAFFTSDEFYQKLLTCTPTKDNTIMGSVIHGKENGVCHFSFPNQKFTNKEKTKTVNLDNCYFPMSDMKNYVAISLEINKFVGNLLKNQAEPSESELVYYDKLIRQKFDYEYKYCR